MATSQGDGFPAGGGYCTWFAACSTSSSPRFVIDLWWLGWVTLVICPSLHDCSCCGRLEDDNLASGSVCGLFHFFFFTTFSPYLCSSLVWFVVCVMPLVWSCFLFSWCTLTRLLSLPFLMMCFFGLLASKMSASLIDLCNATCSVDVASFGQWLCLGRCLVATN